MPSSTYAERPDDAEIREWTRSVIVIKEKHGTYYRDATTPGAFCVSALSILTSRWETSQDESYTWYPKPEDQFAHAPGGRYVAGEWTPGPPLLAAEEIEALPVHLRTAELNRSRQFQSWCAERDRYTEWYDRVGEIVKAQDAEVRYSVLNMRKRDAKPGATTITVPHAKVISAAWQCLMDRADWEYEKVSLEPLR